MIASIGPVKLLNVNM